MIRRSNVDPIIAATVTTLRASSGVTALCPASKIWNDIPPDTARPYIEVTVPSNRRVDTLGRFGGECLLEVHVVTDHEGDQEGNRLLDQCIQALDFTHPTLVGHTMLGLAWDDSVAYPETVNSIKVHHHIGSYRAWAEQSSS
jgi:hypothetical protein